MKQHTDTTYPPLTPIIAPWVHKFLENKEYISSLFEVYGSPINIHHTEPFIQNYKSYAALLDEHSLGHLIFFARKANKCKAFVQAAKEAGFGVDTASYKELYQCLKMGVSPDKLIVTAAIKNSQLLRLAIQHKVLLIIDNLDELEAVALIAEELDTTVNIGVRVSGFVVNERKLYSRFGFDIENVIAIIREKILPQDRMKFKGFHFHLNGYSTEERGAAIFALVKIADALRRDGINTEFIDMGGGLLMNYLAHENQWQTFAYELKKAVEGRRSPITFQNNGLGFKIIDGKLQGKLDTYPYFNNTAKATFLKAILTYEADGSTVAKLLRERNIAFRMEPGRSLLDQSGITLSRVAFRKWDSNQELLIGLEMNRTQLRSSSADFLLDPMVIYRSDPPVKTKPVVGYFVGAYCLEQDVILQRKIALPHTPAIGDMVCFFNTAGYMMHFYESEAHLFELSKNLIIKSFNPEFEVFED